MQELFHVTTKVKEFSGCEDVHFNWFVDGRAEPIEVSYTDYVTNYAHLEDDLRWLPERSLRELFTNDEALALSRYLMQHEGERTEMIKIEKASLPIPGNTLPYHAIAYGGYIGLLEIWKRPGYELPFKVAVHYDLRFSDGVFQLSSEETETRW